MIDGAVADGGARRVDHGAVRRVLAGGQRGAVGTNVSAAAVGRRGSGRALAGTRGQ